MIDAYMKPKYLAGIKHRWNDFSAFPVKAVLCPLLIFALLIAGFTSSAAADSREERIRENYLELKNRIEQDAGRNTALFDADLGAAKAAMGIGYNFGNGLEWTFENNRLRRYIVRIALGAEDGDLYSYEGCVNPDGNLFTAANHPFSTLPYAELELTPVSAVRQQPSAPIHYLRISVSNAFPEASLSDISLTVKYLSLTDKNGIDLLPDKSFLKEYVTPVSEDGVEVLTIPLNAAAGDFTGEALRIRADIQLDHFISDYKNHPELVYEDSYNGEAAADEELAFLKEQGFRTIRLPVTWFAHMNAEGTIDPEWFAEVNRVVDRILSYDFYVIVNIHHDAGKRGWIKADEADFANHEYLYRYLVLQFAENFKNYGEKLILGGPNEIINYSLDRNITSSVPASDIETFNRINQIFVDEVRSTGYGNTNRFLMVGTWYTKTPNLPYYVMPADSAENKIFTEIHDYPENGDIFLESLDDLEAYDAETLAPLNLVMSEFAIPARENLLEKTAFMEIHVSALYQMGIPIIVWDDRADFALLRLNRPEWETKFGSDRVAETMLSVYAANQIQ